MTARLPSPRRRICMPPRSAASGCWHCGMLSKSAGESATATRWSISCGDRIRSLNEIADDDPSRAHLKSDIPRLQRRAKLLNSATHLALASGICTSSLLVVGFASAFLRLQHEYGAGLLFLIAVGLLGGSLFRFGQEVRIGLSEA